MRRNTELYEEERFGDALDYEAMVAESERDLVLDELEQGRRFTGEVEHWQGVYDPADIDLDDEDGYSFGHWLSVIFRNPATR